MQRPIPFAPGEWYHCYTRGVEKRKTFESKRDYERFTELLYLCNNTEKIRRSDFLNRAHADFFSIKRDQPLVGIGAFALMPNHFHILMTEATDGGIVTFMQRLGTAYTMYFNIKHKHVGGIFVGPFRAKHVANDRYLKYVAQYIHLNPVDLFEPEWKEGVARNKKASLVKLEEYPYSSLIDYSGLKRAERAILDPKAVELFKGGMPSISKLFNEAADYYEELF